MKPLQINVSELIIIGRPIKKVAVSFRNRKPNLWLPIFNVFLKCFKANAPPLTDLGTLTLEKR